MMNILTIAFLSLASAVTVLASGNDFSTIAVASKEERPARQTTSIENALKRANTTPVENPSMLRKGERRLLASVSTEYDPYEEHLLQSESSSDLSISDTFSRDLKRYSKNLFGPDDIDSSEVRGNDSNFHRTGFAFKKYPSRSCQKHSGVSGNESDDFFMIDRINKESCETICRYSVNCFGWEYEEVGRKCSIWHDSPIDEHSVEASVCPEVDCYVKYYFHESGKDNNSGRYDDKSRNRKKNKGKKEYDEKGAKTNDMTSRSRRSNKRKDVFSIHSYDKSSNDAPHTYQTLCSNCNDRYGNISRGHYIFGFDCTNNRGGCAPGLLCQPSQLNGSDRWTCQ